MVLIDDSIVRGTTSRKIVRMVRAGGAREVHVRISSPPVTGPCYYGIDTPRKSDLIAAHHAVEEIRRHIEADSLAYLSPEGLLEAVADAQGQRHCTACFTGRYPVAVLQTADDGQFKLFEKAVGGGRPGSPGARGSGGGGGGAGGRRPSGQGDFSAGMTGRPRRRRPGCALRERELT